MTVYDCCGTESQRAPPSYIIHINLYVWSVQNYLLDDISSSNTLIYYESAYVDIIINVNI